ncbi:MAG: O-antigen ligase family protein [Lachnospiraceae bacterium]|nr:O-antigen ligase family protein [Lachnospiraceae bacterium]
MSKSKRIIKPDKCILLTWFAMAVIPLIVHLDERGNIFRDYAWFSSNETNFDFFLVWKMYGLFAVMAAMFLYAMTDFYNGKRSALHREKRKNAGFVLLLAGLYVVLALLSAIFAHDTGSAFLGGYAQYEPIIVLAAYVVIFMFTYFYVNGTETLMFLYGMLVAGIAVLSLIGVTQYLNMDFYGSDIGKSLITLFSNVDSDRVSLKFEPGRVYMSLYNPNYVGSYVILVLPIVAVGMVIFKKMWPKAACAVIALMLVICLIGSGSVTGMTALILSAVLFFLLAFAAVKNAHKKIITATAITCVIAAAIALANMEVIKNAVSKYRMEKDNFIIREMELSGDGVIIDYKGEKLRIACENEVSGPSLSLYDGSGKQLLLSAVGDNNGGMAVAGNDFYSELVIGNVSLASNTRGFYAKCGENTFVFTNDNDEGKYMYYNPLGNITDDIVNSHGVLFDNYERFASGRGFIWSRTIPLLADNLIIGCGPDNFVYEFPNNDYVSLMNNGYIGEVVTRPHNMYLQIGVQTGVLSLVLFILIYVIYFIQSIRIYTKSTAFNALWMIGAAVMAGTAGYMVCGLANDSTVCVAPVFWGMLGLEYACNYLMKRSKN